MRRIDSVSSAWIPEDDLLLKNSLEAGASLEALAKGAVKFSRGFTLCELRDRWHSLLYDPAVSAPASARMVKFQQSGSNSLSRFSRLDDLKGSEKAPEKRKGGSIRRQYYAMRKRIKRENFNSSDLGFFEICNNHNYSRQGHNFQDHIRLNHEAEAEVGDTMFGDCLANNLGLEETDFEILRQAFPESIGIIATTAVVDKSADAFHTEGCCNSVENDYMNGSMREDGSYKLIEDVCPLLRNDMMGSFDPGIEPKNDTHIHKGESDNFVKCMDSEELLSSQTLLIGKTFEADVEAKLMSTYGSMNESNQIICSGFGKKQHFSSPGSDGSASFHSMGFSSPLPRMPLWRTMEDVSAPDMPVDENNAESNLATEEALALPEVRRENSPGYDVAQSMSLLEDKLDGTDYINCSAVPEGEYADLPDSLLNLSNEDDILYMHVVAKDTMDDIPGSQMLDSSKMVPEDALCNADATTLLVASTGIATPSIQCHEESKDSSFHDQPDACHWDIDMPSTSVSYPDSLQLIEGRVICTLNTEDPEIPCNDDIFLLIHPSTSFASSIRPQIAADSIDPLSSSADEKDGEQGLSAGKDLASSFTRSQMAGPNLASEFDFAHPRVGYALKYEPSDTRSLCPLFGQPDKIRNPGQSRPTHTNPVLIGDRVLTEDGIDTSTICSEMFLGAEVGSLKMIDSDHENSDSDSDIPHFSDIEAMILEMDLAYAQDSCFTSEVARNQYNHSKRMIIRLEQTARGSLQRAMSSLGAFAIFYGRCFNYYIKKTEVTIGRSTDDTDVDIDLRKEGRANMISRRQATIKMETDGSFTLKNLGKSSISLNGNSIAHGQVAALSSSCLIEIRGMCFMFEINDKYVRRYLDDIIKKSQGKCKTFDWTPEGEP
ncbi:hypothetical protein L6452_40758 [Arctium lappa]|uniref:Uncharacterized protein n=1 Tax=Arctium lappa TaxID=4217 RepID=A0ACB8XNC5_ARCLA|nr:hypothetical protein L6452_40758 [Arctium lappa]